MVTLDVCNVNEISLEFFKKLILEEGGEKNSDFFTLLVKASNLSSRVDSSRITRATADGHGDGDFGAI